MTKGKYMISSIPLMSKVNINSKLYLVGKRILIADVLFVISALLFGVVLVVVPWKYFNVLNLPGSLVMLIYVFVVIAIRFLCLPKNIDNHLTKVEKGE